MIFEATIFLKKEMLLSSTLTLERREKSNNKPKIIIPVRLINKNCTLTKSMKPLFNDYKVLAV